MVSETMYVKNLKATCQIEINIYICKQCQVKITTYKMWSTVRFHAGPTLFFLYINDIVHASCFRVRLFVDDTALILSDKNLNTTNESQS